MLSEQPPAGPLSAYGRVAGVAVNLCRERALKVVGAGIGVAAATRARTMRENRYEIPMYVLLPFPIDIDMGGVIYSLSVFLYNMGSGRRLFPVVWVNVY